MNYNNVNCIFIILLITILLVLYVTYSPQGLENYQNYDLSNAGNFPSNVETPLLKNEYPLTNRKNVTNNSYSKIWWYYPIFDVGSYAQITNNLRFQKNPDDGKCITAEFCGSMYKDHPIESNIIKPLPPVPDTPGIRVNYYRTQENLFLGPQPGPVLELPAF